MKPSPQARAAVEEIYQTFNIVGTGSYLDGDGASLVTYETSPDSDEIELIIDKHFDMPHTCDGCRHWKHWTRCTPDSGECLKERVTSRGNYNKPDYLAAMGDGSPALFSTGPKFGCVHWEKKP